MALDIKYVKLDDILTFQFKIYAHTKNNEPVETLQEHTRLCHKYLRELWEDKQLDKQMNRFVDSLLPERCSKIAMNLFFKLFVDCITFHDVGKINTAFQQTVMKNKTEQITMDYYIRGTGHALFSAVLYIDYEYNELKKAVISKEEQMQLTQILLTNAYIISKHHGDLQEMGEFIEKFRPDEAIYDIVNGMYKDQFLKGLYKGPFCENSKEIIGLLRKYSSLVEKDYTQAHSIAVFIYARFIYSLIVTCDYYATSDFETGTKIKSFGTAKSVSKLVNLFQNSELTKRIRQYEKEKYQKLDQEELQMNDLRSEMFLDSEKKLKKNLQSRIYFLEAPTGCGKSNTAVNLSLHFLKEGYQKVYYVYPFNTLVEQNVDAMHRTFGKEIDSELGILNSITEIKTEDNYLKDTIQYYQEALLNRQFLNYPIILTTHVSLFDTLFGNKKSAVFGSLQLQNSVIVLDEIQSYDNKIWAEIIIFLKAYAQLLNMKIIIMSATLPDLELLTEEDAEAVRLISNSQKYFENPIFKERVNCDYSLLNEEISVEKICEKIMCSCNSNTKILVEFIKKDTAKCCYQMLKSFASSFDIQLLTGEDSMADRKKTISYIQKESTKGIILVATQIVEAGVDIDMDIGFKDISKLDSEEQFLGRINRSCKRHGKVFFFNLDLAEKIYTNDIRVVNKNLTLECKDMREILESKNFSPYYKRILKILRTNRNQSTGEKGLQHFFQEKVRRLNFPAISTRMELIKPDMWHQTVFIEHDILTEDQEVISGEQVWKNYKSLLQNSDMDYAEKKVKLSQIRVYFDYFIYQVKMGNVKKWSDQIGEILYIQDGDQYFEDGKLNLIKFQEENGLFID